MCLTYIHAPTYIHHEVEVVVTYSVSFFFVYIPDMICMMCCTWYVFVMALKVKKASSTRNWGGLPTKDMYICYFECSRSRTKVYKPHLAMPGTWCRLWFFVRLCDTWCIIRQWLYSYERFFTPVPGTWYLVHNMAAALLLPVSIAAGQHSSSPSALLCRLNISQSADQPDVWKEEHTSMSQ